MKDKERTKDRFSGVLKAPHEHMAELEPMENRSGQAENKIKHSMSFLEKIINTISDPLFVRDETHRWVYINDAACEVMGLPREALIGKTDYDLFLKSQADVFWKRDNLVLETGQPDIREEEITWRGKRHIICTRRSLLTDPSTGKRFIAATIRDISEQKQKEMALDENQKN